MEIGPVSQKMNGYDNIFWLGEKQSSQTHVLYKYMNVKYAIEFLKTGRFLMNEPSAWSDPYEKRFYTADLTTLRGSNLTASIVRALHNRFQTRPHGECTAAKIPVLLRVRSDLSFGAPPFYKHWIVGCVQEKFILEMPYMITLQNR